MKENVVTIALIAIAIGLFCVVVAKDLRKKRRQGRKHSQRLLLLRRNLLVKALGDESTVDSLIQYERQVYGDRPLETLMQDAIDRWEHDNR